MKTITILIISWVLCLSLAVYAFEDRADMLSSGSSHVFSPGYINVAKQKTERVLSQTRKKQNPITGLINSTINFVGEILFLNDDSDEPEKSIVPELKKKSSTGAVPEQQPAVIFTDSQYDIEIGNGTSKFYENGRLIYETVNGTRRIYAGFDNVGKSTIQDAMAIAAAGDKIFVKGGIYDTGTITLRNGVSLYGGYAENGVRDTKNTSSVITGSFAVSYVNKPSEINGFTIEAKTRDTIVISNSSNITIANNIFTGSDVNIIGIFASYSSNIFIKDNKFDNRYTSGLYASYYATFIYTTSNDFFGRYGVRTVGTATVYSSRDYFFSGASGSMGNVTVTNRAEQPNIKSVSPNARIDFAAYPYSIVSYNSRPGYDLYGRAFLSTKMITTFDTDNLSSVFKGLLLARKTGEVKEGGNNETQTAAMINQDDLSVSALAVPIGNLKSGSDEHSRIISFLVDIVNNPTREQNEIMDMIELLIGEINGIENQDGSTELEKTRNDLIQIVAAVLLAQAIPDLLKEGDMAGIKTIFSELDNSKKLLLSEYEEATKPYYEEMVKTISKNIAILQLKGILPMTMTEEELRKTMPNEIGKILDKIRRSVDRTAEEERILQGEVGLRQKYIEPNRRILEENMKALLKDINKRLYTMLEGKGIIKEREHSDVKGTGATKPAG